MSDSGIRRILVPLDGSEASKKAASYAIMLAKCHSAEIVAMHTISTPSYLGYKGSGVPAREFNEAAKRSAERWFADVKELATKENIEIKTEILTDIATISDAIVHYAKDISADLIVLGTRERGAAKRLLLGSVTQGVVVHAHCPVLVVR